MTEGQLLTKITRHMKTEEHTIHNEEKHNTIELNSENYTDDRITQNQILKLQIDCRQGH